MTNGLMGIAITEAKLAVEDVEGSLEDKLRAAMQKTYRHWLVHDEDGQFKAACAAVYLLVDETDQERIKAELAFLSGMSALISGVPVDMERLLEGHDEGPETIGLLKLWDEVKGASERR